jgi:hypothetical protein
MAYVNDAVIVDFVRIGMNDRRCRHSCNFARLKVGIASRSIFGLSPQSMEGVDLARAPLLDVPQ